MNERVSRRFDVGKLQGLIDAELPARRGTAAYRSVVKRILDIAIVLIVALPTIGILLPLMAIIALDGRSPIYIQKRLGRDGRVFSMFKLRSMVPGADAILESYLERNPAARAEWDVSQKLRHDPRITVFGAFIRKTSLDELPQLLNVLLGDMSIVGPRPMMVEQEELYPGRAYFEMRPGITGFWQVSERNESSFAQRAYYDAEYFRQMSLRTDLWVILRTFRVVFAGTGH